jgi:hypothetical protein
LEHTRTSPDEQGTDAATGTRPGIGSENAHDPTPPQAPDPAQQPPGQQPPGAGYQQERPEPVSVETAVEEEIMSKLPRKRPQRRGTRRTAAQSNARKTTARKTTAKKTGTKRTSTARGGTRTAKAKNAPSLPEQAIGAVISTARLPLRIGSRVARSAGNLIGRGNR